jgi:hypothetical protein
MSAMMTDSHRSNPEQPTATLTHTRTQRRPYLLIVLVAALAVFQAGAAARGINIPQELLAKTRLSLPLELAASVFWAAAALVVLASLWLRKPRARLYAAWLAVGFSIYSALRLLLFSQADYDRGRFPFLVVMVALLLVIPAVYIVRRRA